MKRLVAFLAVASVILLLGGRYFAQQAGGMQQSTKAQWARVTGAIENGLPETAIKELAPIVESAMKEGRDAEAIRAIATRINLQSAIQGNKPADRIGRLENEIESAKESMRPVMKVLLANWYWDHFRQNRWRYQQRTAISGEAVTGEERDDIESWSLQRILDKVDEVFTDALSAHDQLKQIPVDQYDALLVKGNVADEYRPTVFDVLAYNAITFYSIAEQYETRSRDHFTPQAAGPILADAEDFISWDPDTTDQDSTTLKAIRLYQELLRDHRDDEDRRAFADTDLARVVFAESFAVGTDKKERYRAALNRLIDEHKAIEVSSLVRHYLAESHRSDKELLMAHAIATEGARSFPDSVGGKRCKTLVNTIEARQLNITTERVWNHQADGSPTAEIQIDYRNVSKVHFRAVPFDPEEYLNSRRYQPEHLDRNELARLLRKKPVRAWSVELPPTDDFSRRSHSIAAPRDLAGGAYFVIASANESFDQVDNQVSLTEAWVSELAFVVRSDYQRAGLDGFVLDAHSGSPISGASVECWGPNRNGARSVTQRVTTDAQGYFRFEFQSRTQTLLVARNGDQMLTSSRMFDSGRSESKQKEARTRFLTDRAIYRPGQTIQYKGICHTYNQATDDYATLPGQSVVVALFDANNQQVERIEHVANALGGFSGSVTAPADRLTGAMTLRVIGGPQGMTSVNVEQYKRPKFKTELEPPQVAPRLNEPVTITGLASAYSGAPIDDAVVSWRVVREVQYPGWWYFRCWWAPPQGNSQEITQGNASVKSDGTYEIEFEALPDLSVPEESEPTFRYTVYADVTDATGETRSASTTIRVGYTALSASISTDKWLVHSKPVKLQITTRTLDGVGQQADGELMIHDVVQPDSVVRRDLISSPLPRTAGNQPDEPDPANPNSWKLGEVIETLPFESDESGQVFVETPPLQAGIYRAILKTRDRFRKPIHSELQFQVVDPDSDRLDAKLTELFLVETDSVEPGEEFRALWGTGYEQARVFVEIEHRGRVLRKFWSRPDQTQLMIRQPIDESMRGGLTLRTTMVRENRLYSRTHHIHVPWSNKRLQITWERFVSKLEPGSKETWKAKITGPDATKFAGEMAATLYDASLDAYQPHRWSDTFGVFRTERSRLRFEFAQRGEVSAAGI